MLTEKEKTAARKIAKIITNNTGVIDDLYTLVGGDIPKDNIDDLYSIVLGILAAGRTVPRETTIEEKIAAVLEPFKKDITARIDELIQNGITVWADTPTTKVEEAIFNEKKIRAQMEKIKKLTPNNIAIGWTYDITVAHKLEQELIEMLKKYCAIQRESCVQVYLKFEQGRPPYLGKIDIQNASEPDFK